MSDNDTMIRPISRQTCDRIVPLQQRRFTSSS